MNGSSVFLWNVGEVELVPFHAQCLGQWMLTVMPRDVRRTEGDPAQEKMELNDELLQEEHEYQETRGRLQ